MSTRIISLTSILLACVLGAPVVEAAQIKTDLHGAEKLKISGTGTETDSILVKNFTMSGNHWKATCDGIHYNGTFTTSGSKFTLKFSSSSKKALKKVIQKWAEDMLGAKVKVTDFNIVMAKGVFNSSKTGVKKIKLKVKAQGKSKGDSGKAIYTLNLS